jgi:hypothetical protein
VTVLKLVDLKAWMMNTENLKSYKTELNRFDVGCVLMKSLRTFGFVVTTTKEFVSVGNVLLQLLYIYHTQYSVRSKGILN